MTKGKIVLLYSASLIPCLNTEAELLLVLPMVLPSSSLGAAILLAEKQPNHLPLYALSTELVTNFKQSLLMKETQGYRWHSLDYTFFITNEMTTKELKLTGKNRSGILGLG